MAGLTVKDLEEAVERGIQRGIAAVRNTSNGTLPGRASSNSHESSSRNVAGVIGRARDLLRCNTMSVSNALGTSLGSAPQPKRRRIGHQYTSSKPAKPAEQKTLEISVVDFMDIGEFGDENGKIPDVLPNYNLGKDDILFSGTLDLMTDDKEEAIRSKIVEVLSSRLPGITPMDFSFVKVCRKQVSTPACKQGHRWDFPQIKTITGQGKLYVRLNKPQQEMRGTTTPPTPPDTQIEIEDIGDIATPGPSGIRSDDTTALSCLEAEEKPPESTAAINQKQTRKHATPNVLGEEDRNDVAYLKNMFPNMDEAYLIDKRQSNITLQDTVEEILGEGDSNGFEEPSSVKDILASHRKKQALENIRVNRVDVDRESLWEDSIITFKNPSFNACAKLRVRFVGEAGMDAGGLRIEYCTLLSRAIFSNEAALFEGNCERYVPIYNSSAIRSNMFALAGRMISYMLVHHNIAIPCLSPAVYTYFATGDIDKAASTCCISDLPDLEIREIISQLNDVTSDDELGAFLLQNPSIRDILSTSGWVKNLTMKNKGYAAMNLLVHEVLTKRKMALDQLRDGLQCLNVLSLLTKHTDMMRVYFVKCGDEHITPEVMTEKVYKNAKNEEVISENERARQFFLRSLTTFYRDQKEVGMKKVLMFSTGRDSLPPLGLEEKVELEYRGATSFFAETCLLKLQVPIAHDTFEEFYKQFVLAANLGYKGFGNA